MAREPILGIDLGTSNSCVAVMTAEGPIVIPNRGQTTTPSVIAIGADGAISVGNAAKRQVYTNADNTFVAIKRLIGRRFDEAEVQTRAVQGLFESPSGDIRVRHRERVYALAELQALILAELKSAAEAHLGCAVSKAVITVPAYFNDGQRQATRDAGTIAGLEIVRMINEPTAAAVAYGFGRGLEKKVVVYDLGGGTFDISIVSCKSDGTFEVLGTGGDTLLGGEDFDRLIAEWLGERFKREHGFDAPNEHAIRARFKQAAEDAKRELSMREIVEIEIPHLMVHPENGPLHLHCTLTRHVFDHKTKKLVARTVDLTKQALDEANTAIAEVDDLLLVGGASRIPAIHQAVTALLGKKPSQRVHPDEAVALGAALIAHGLSGGAHASPSSPPVLLKDRTPYTLGVRLRGNRREALIPKNTALPARVRRNFATTREGQTFVDVVVLQGESEVADECTLLADFRLDDIAPGPPGGVSLDLTLSVDESGVVNVTATDVATQRAQSIRVLATTDLSREDVARMRAAAVARAPGSIAEPVAPLSAQSLPADFPPEPPSAHMPIHLGDAKGPSHVPVEPAPQQISVAPQVSVIPANVTQPIVQRQVLSTNVTQPIAQRMSSVTQPLPRESRPVRRDPRMEEDDDASSAPPRVESLAPRPSASFSRPPTEPLAARGASAAPAPTPTLISEPPVVTVSTPPLVPEPLLVSEPPRSMPRVDMLTSPPKIELKPEPLVSTPSVSPISPVSTPPVPSKPPVSRRASAKPGGFRSQLKALIATCEAAAKTAAVKLAASEFATETVEEGQAMLVRARAALESEDDAQMRDCAFELARIEQTLTELLA